MWLSIAVQFLLVGGSVFSLWFYSRPLLAFIRGDNQVLKTRYHFADAAMAAIYFLGFLSLFILGMLSKLHGEEQKITLHLIVMGSSIYVSACILLIGLHVYTNNNPIELYGLRRFFPLRAIGWLLAGLPLIYFIQQLGNALLEKKQGAQEIVRFIQTHHDPKTLIVAGVLIIVVAPVTEEFLFRGFLYGAISRYLGRYTALLLSALLFAAAHNYLPAFPALFTFAILLTLAYENSGSLWTPIVMHSCFNALGFLMILYFPTLAQ